MTPLDHENATAIVSISGLALGCYNKSTQNYEVAFLRHKCHSLTIEVKKKLPYGESTMMYEIKDNNHRIFIDAENAVSPEDPIYFIGDDYDDFDRTQLTGDFEDFRWVVDFERNLNGGDQVELQLSKDSDDDPLTVTEMYISKPRLYGDKALITQGPFSLVSLDSEGNPVSGKDAEPFGFFTEGTKADITCQDGGAVIFRVDGPQGFQVHLPHGYGPHEITITNICPPKAASKEESDRDTDPRDDDQSAQAEPTDFRLYYLLIKETAGKKYDVRPTNEGEGAVCNVGNLGGTGRASLYPLPLGSE
jgi:hypothetical protein